MENVHDHYGWFFIRYLTLFDIFHNHYGEFPKSLWRISIVIMEKFQSYFGERIEGSSKATLEIIRT